MVTALNQRLKMLFSEAGLSAADARVIIGERRLSKAGAPVQSIVRREGPNTFIYASHDLSRHKLGLEC